MKLTVRNLLQQTFQIEVNPADKISTVKEAVEKEKGYPVAQQKLIFSGKILDDAASVEDCKIGEKDFVVVMVAKPKPAASASSVAAAPAAAPLQKEEPTSAAAPAPAPPAPALNAQPTAAPPVQPAQEPPSSTFSSGLVVGSEYNNAVANMVEMGFPREQVIKAMRASFNNPDRAVEYLMTGIPEHLERETYPAASATAQTADSTRATPDSEGEAHSAAAAPSPSGPVNLFEAAAQAAQQQEHEQRSRSSAMGGAGQDISFLANHPQFQQLRALVRSNPALLEPLLQQLGQANPQLLALINQNQQTFMRMLQDDVGAEGEEEVPGGGAQYVSVTPEERDALERLEGLGFERNLVLEAFLACDKNEELAANYLLNMNFEDDDQ